MLTHCDDGFRKMLQIPMQTSPPSDLTLSVHGTQSGGGGTMEVLLNMQFLASRSATLRTIEKQDDKQTKSRKFTSFHLFADSGNCATCVFVGTLFAHNSLCLGVGHLLWIYMKTNLK